MEKFLSDDITVAEAAQALIAAVHMVTADTEAIKLIKVGKLKHKASHSVKKMEVEN